jgi:hypothetical protein
MEICLVTWFDCLTSRVRFAMYDIQDETQYALQLSVVWCLVKKKFENTYTTHVLRGLIFVIHVTVKWGNILLYLSMTLQPFVGPWPRFQFLNPVHSRTPWTGDQPVTRPLPIHRTTQTQNKRTQTSMSRVRFEPTIPVFELTKTVPVLGRQFSRKSPFYVWSLFVGPLFFELECSYSPGANWENKKNALCWNNTCPFVI